MNVTALMHKRMALVPVLIPVAVMLVLWAVGFLHWANTDDTVTLLVLGYIGLIVGVGIGSYVTLPDRSRPAARRVIMALVGGLLLALTIITDHGNMQIEGLLAALLAGIAPFILLHFAIAKVIGPLIFGRIWCGWACWYAMVFDMLPYPYSRFRHPRWGWPRYVHLGLSFVFVALLVVGAGYHGIAEGRSGLLWFAGGLGLYYIAGIVMALALKDNRAFCKYLCPIAVPMKATARFSLLKIAGEPSHCANCEACVEMCPMNIRIKDYLAQGQRVLSTECTLCQTCINVCPHNSLRLSLGLDAGGKEYTDYEPPAAR